MAERTPAEAGLIGLAVMGQNLALNMADHGFKVAVFNRTTQVMKDFITANPDTLGGLIGCEKLTDLVAAVTKPRKVVILVKAGPAVDTVIKQLIEAGVERDDLIVDCGNSQWTDTIRREKEYSAHCRFFGSGVSGGEIGARFGPSLMPGGDPQAWKHLEPIWKAIAAKVDPQTGKPIETALPGRAVESGVPCTAYIGENGAGHYVKMVHNGIEYIDMQLIGEAYFLIRNLFNVRANELAEIFARWNEGDLDSYLIQITADILKQRDPRHPNEFLVDYVLDTAQQKGTGKWTSINALDLGIPANSIADAVFARCLSALKAERVEASRRLRGPDYTHEGNRDEWIDAVRDALYCSKICAYAQGFQLMRAAEGEYGWKLDLGTIASIWRGGCIIRARFLQKITDAYLRNPKLGNLLLDPYFQEQIHKNQKRWRKVVALAAETGIPAPAFMSALAYYDGYRTVQLPANLLQAQRDYFGAHGYERTDEPRGKSFHLDWPKPDRPEIELRTSR
jgi:6-phosphogluconate dehydrogenase